MSNLSNLKIMSSKSGESGGFKSTRSLFAAGCLAVSVFLAALPAAAQVGVNLGISIGGGSGGGVVDTVTNTVDNVVDHVTGKVDDVTGGGINAGVNSGVVNAGVNVNGPNGANGANGVPGGTPGAFPVSCELLGSPTFNSFMAVDRSEIPLGQIQGVVMTENNITSARFLTTSVVFGKRRCITVSSEDIQVVGSRVMLPITQTELFQKLGN